MVAVHNKLVIYYLVIWLVERIASTASPKFNFKKVFKTPRENYEARIAELDKCEILERSNFSSEDQDEDKAAGPQSNQSDPKVFVNTEVNVRFGRDPETTKPTFSEPATSHSNNHLAPSSAHPQYLPYFPPPYMPFNVGLQGLPFGQAPCHAYLAPGWYNPYHYHFYPGFHPFVPAAHFGHNPHLFNGGKGLFTPFNYTSGVQLDATVKPPTPIEKPSVSHANQECSYPNDEYRKAENWKKVDSLSQLPFDKWMTLAVLSDGNTGGSNKPNSQNAAIDDTTMDHTDSCVTTTDPPSNNPVSFPKETTPQHTLTTTNSPRTQEPSSNDIALPGDVVLENIENAPPCKDLSLNADCLHRSGNVRFVKIKPSDLGNWGDGKIVLDDSNCKICHSCELSKTVEDSDWHGDKAIDNVDDIDCRNTKKTCQHIDDVIHNGSEAQKNINGLDLKICDKIHRKISQSVDEICFANSKETNKFIDINADVNSNDEEATSHIEDLIFTNDKIGDDDNDEKCDTDNGAKENLHEESCPCGKANIDGKSVYDFGDIYRIKTSPITANSPQMPYPYPSAFFNLNPWWMSANQFEPCALYSHFKPSSINKCTKHVTDTPQVALEK